VGRREKNKEDTLGQKVHPTGFRLGVVKGWQSRWYAGRDYKDILAEDYQIRQMINKDLASASVSRIEIERAAANQVAVTIHTARPGIVIGKSGEKVDKLRAQLEAKTHKRVRLNIMEIRQPELDATLVARSIAEQLEKRVSFRRAMKQAVQKAQRSGAKGVKIIVGGRLGGAEIARSEKEVEGKVPLHTLRADIDYGQAEAHTTFGVIGIKVWIYKGDILPSKHREPGEVAEAAPQHAFPREGERRERGERRREGGERRERRERGERREGGERPQGERRERPQGERAGRPQGQAQGERRERPQGERGPRREGGERPQGERRERPQGERRERPQGERGPRREGGERRERGPRPQGQAPVAQDTPVAGQPQAAETPVNQAAPVVETPQVTETPQAEVQQAVQTPERVQQAPVTETSQTPEASASPAPESEAGA
jgi:small subunit ribosomal protein S3